ncbi:MAG: hypothetical protein ACTSQA_01120 [Candidatus Heimdallarchaeaceae archaeon]
MIVSCGGTYFIIKRLGNLKYNIAIQDTPFHITIRYGKHKKEYYWVVKLYDNSVSDTAQKTISIQAPVLVEQNTDAFIYVSKNELHLFNENNPDFWVDIAVLPNAVSVCFIKQLDDNIDTRQVLNSFVYSNFQSFKL